MNEENLTAKTPPGDFQVTTPEIPLLSQQAVISKWITVSFTNLQLSPYPNNTQLDLFYSDNFPFWCTASNMWLTNARIPVRDFNYQLKKVVGYRIFQFIPMMKIKKMLSHKTLRCTYIATFPQEWWTRAKLYLQLQIAWTNFSQHLCNLYTLWRPLKWSFYTSRVRRKEGPNT